ncbi:MAG: hypothetical protein ACU0CI_05625 [Shimia sp.]
MRALALLSLIALAACGADGEPIQPTGSVGVSIGSGGITPNVSIGATQGPFTVRVGS